MVAADRRHRRGRGVPGRQPERGAALVEFAILVPVLAILVFGTIDFGRVWQVEEQLKNSAREGANYAQYYPWAQNANTHCSAPGTVDWHAQQEGGHPDFVVTSSLSASALTSCPTTNPNAKTGPFAAFASGSNITITVTQPNFKLLTPMISSIIPSLTPTASVTVKIQ